MTEQGYVEVQIHKWNVTSVSPTPTTPGIFHASSEKKIQQRTLVCRYSESLSYYQEHRVVLYREPSHWKKKTKQKACSPAWALHFYPQRLQRQQICLVVLYSQVAVMSQRPPVPQNWNSGFFRVSCSAMVLMGSKYICVKITGSSTDFNGSS